MAHTPKGTGNEPRTVATTRDFGIDPTARAAMLVVGGFLAFIVLVTLLPRSVTLPFPQPLDDPRSWLMPLFLMSVPGLFVFHVTRTFREARRARTWTVGQARITSSGVAIEHRKHSGEATRVFNVPAVAYSFSNGRSTFEGHRIGIGEPPGNAGAIGQMLNRFPVGATVPVYYDPANPGRAVLDRDLPEGAWVIWLVVALVFIVCAALSGLVLWPDEIMEWLGARFPEGSQPFAAIFFAISSLVLLANLVASRRQAKMAGGWPVVRGRIVSSKVDSFWAKAGSARTGTQTRYYQAVVEYAYAVEGREYHSTHLAVGPQIAGAEAGAKEKAGRYVAGSEVEVHYDPADPSNAVLDVKVIFAWPTLVIGLLFAGLACFFGGLFK